MNDIMITIPLEEYKEAIKRDAAAGFKVEHAIREKNQAEEMAARLERELEEARRGLEHARAGRDYWLDQYSELVKEQEKEVQEDE